MHSDYGTRNQRFLTSSLGLEKLAMATHVSMDLFPEDRAVSARMLQETEKLEKERRAHEAHLEKYGVFGASIEMQDAATIQAPLPLEPLLGEWAHSCPRPDIKDLLSKEDTRMQRTLLFAKHEGQMTQAMAARPYSVKRGKKK